MQKLLPLKKINFIIGQNNSGKSNIITYLYEHLDSIAKHLNSNQSGALNFSELDSPRILGPFNAIVGFPLSFSDSELEKYIMELLPNDEVVNNNRRYLKIILTSDEFLDENGFIWFFYKSASLNGQYVFSPDVNKIKSLLSQREWHSLWIRLTNKSGGSFEQHWFPEVLKKIIPRNYNLPNIEFIPAIRKVGESGTSYEGFSGVGLIERLAEYQNPELTNQKSKIKFKEINDFLKNVLENDTAEIEIPYDRQMIIVHMDNKSLPLSSLGTGIHEVVILATASTILEDSVLCVEEPELHLHPLLQRKLIKYLSEHTSNQYIFTTHSAHLLNINDVEIFHVTYSQGGSKVEAITTTKEKSNICRDLGYNASDLLQTNCVIWVEGPSDRIYVNYWLKHIDSNLVEGVQYSIMFYGGRLFSHLTADDNNDSDDLDDFISLRKLNRNACIIFDSDKDSSRSHISKTKKRLKEEFDKGPGFAWVTKGREIENYIDPDIVEECIKKVHPSANKIISKNEWSNTLKYEKSRTKEERVGNKVKVSRYYVKNKTPDLSVLDLNKKILMLQQFIYDSNNL